MKVKILGFVIAGCFFTSELNAHVPSARLCSLFIDRFTAVEEALAAYPHLLEAHLATSQSYANLSSDGKRQVRFILYAKQKVLATQLAEHSVGVLRADTDGLSYNEILALSMHLDDLTVRTQVAHYADAAIAEAHSSEPSSVSLNWSDVVDGREKLSPGVLYTVSAVRPESVPSMFYITFTARNVVVQLSDHKDYGKFMDAIQKGFAVQENTMGLKRMRPYTDKRVEVKIKAHGHWRLYGQLHGNTVSITALDDAGGN